MKENEQVKIEIFKILNDHYKNDFSLYWTRSNFFLLIQVGLLSYFSSNYISNKEDEISYRLLVSIMGLILSIIWFLVVVSSTKWINVWRKKVIEIDNDINPYKSFSRGEDLETSSPKLFHLTFRPEIISNILSMIFVALWAGLIILLLSK